MLWVLKRTFLTHKSVASFLWDIGDSADPYQTPHYGVAGQALHCFLTDCYIKIKLKIKNTTHQHLKQKQTDPTDNSGNFHLA